MIISLLALSDLTSSSVEAGEPPFGCSIISGRHQQAHADMVDAIADAASSRMSQCHW